MVLTAHKGHKDFKERKVIREIQVRKGQLEPMGLTARKDRKVKKEIKVIREIQDRKDRPEPMV
jgi:hypothetical protein